MDQTNVENELRVALTAFETMVATPVVSGELAEWTDKVKKSWSRASTLIHEHTSGLHRRQYEEISKEDPALFQQIELLKAEDEAIDAEREKLNRRVQSIAEHGPALGPDEAKAEPHIKSLVDEAIALVGRVRKQEVAVQTWFVEAFNRERGGGD